MGVVNCEGVRSEDCDSDGELVSVETCVFAVFEFISGLVESRRLRGLLPPILPTLAHNLIAHMQLTEEEVDSVDDAPTDLSLNVSLGSLLVGRCGTVCRR